MTFNNSYQIATTCYSTWVIKGHHFNMEQYNPYSLICDLFSRNLETYRYWYELLNSIILTWNNIFHIRIYAICSAEMWKHICIYFPGLYQLNTIVFIIKEISNISLRFWCIITTKALYWLYIRVCMIQNLSSQFLVVSTICNWNF